MLLYLSIGAFVNVVDLHTVTKLADVIHTSITINNRFFTIDNLWTYFKGIDLCMMLVDEPASVALLRCLLRRRLDTELSQQNAKNLYDDEFDIVVVVRNFVLQQKL